MEHTFGNPMKDDYDNIRFLCLRVLWMCAICVLCRFASARKSRVAMPLMKIALFAAAIPGVFSQTNCLPQRIALDSSFGAVNNLPSGWFTGNCQSFCTWTGIRCAIVCAPTCTLIITRIELASKSLSGSIDLTSLPSTLELLDIQNNQLSGLVDLTSLPTSIKTVLMNGNQFSGPVRFDQLPSSVTLIDLDVDVYCDSVGCTPPRIGVPTGPRSSRTCTSRTSCLAKCNWDLCSAMIVPTRSRTPTKAPSRAPTKAPFRAPTRGYRRRHRSGARTKVQHGILNSTIVDNQNIAPKTVKINLQTTVLKMVASTLGLMVVGAVCFGCICSAAIFGCICCARARKPLAVTQQPDASTADEEGVTFRPRPVLIGMDGAGDLALPELVGLTSNSIQTPVPEVQSSESESQ